MPWLPENWRLLSLVSKCTDAVREIEYWFSQFKSNPLEQMYRDVRAAIVHQPFQGYDALAWLGKLAFGIPHDTLPRWV